MFTTVFALLGILSASAAWDGPKVTCTVGNAAAKPGPGYATLGTPHPSKTVATLRLGNYWEQGYSATTLTDYFQFGAELTAAEIRKESIQVTEKMSDEQVLELQRKFPSAIDFQVTASLESKAVRVKFAQRVNALNETIGMAVIIDNPGEIAIPESNFGLPFVKGDVAVVCVGQLSEPAQTQKPGRRGY